MIEFKMNEIERISKLEAYTELMKKDINRLENKIDNGFDRLEQKLDVIVNDLSDKIDKNTSFRERINGQIALIGGAMTLVYTVIEQLIKYFIEKR